MNKTTKFNNVIHRRVYTPGVSVMQREDGSQGRTITGYAILFNSRSAPFYEDEDGAVYEVIAPGAVTKELLDQSDIKMTMFHDRQLILARSKAGKGTLSYRIDEKGVAFEFEAPETADGDKALELVRRGDIDGCSFAFSTFYYDPAYVSAVTEVDGQTGNVNRVYTVNQITGIYDFTLTPDPAYPETECEADRELVRDLRQAEGPEKPDTEQSEIYRAQVAEMRRAANFKL